jgi:hypothetical protein
VSLPPAHLRDLTLVAVAEPRAPWATFGVALLATLWWRRRRGRIAG